MSNPLRALIIRVLRVPPEPDNPLGEHGSLRVFRAAPNFFKYNLIMWGIGQAIAIIGSIIGLVLFHFLVIRSVDHGGLKALLVAIELGGFVFVLAQTAVSFMLLRLDFEMRWYKITDRSLRIREGIWSVREMTMTFANIQNVSISQGPVQRLLGIADLKVETAGGGGGGADPNQKSALALNMHTGFFRGVDNAPEIRDLMRERLKALRDTGLGDLDERHDGPAAEATPRGGAPGAAFSAAALGALRELRAEAGALRAAAEELQARRA